jgi:hypothetical protein
MPGLAVHGTGWFKSSYSDNSSNNCVECRIIDGVGVFVRDSKDPELPPFRFAPGEWTAFLNGAKVGKFDLPRSTGHPYSQRCHVSVEPAQLGQQKPVLADHERTLSA